VPAAYDRAAASRAGDNAATAMKSVVVDTHAYDWEGDRPLRTTWADTIIYELHVRGFTRHESSGVRAAVRGTYAGLVEKIPYLVDLGITAVELLPVFQFDPFDAPAGRVNYWGYQPVSFFAPHAGYAAHRDPGGVLDEFRDMVKALHRAGLEVILDVVFNHTTEGGHDGPTCCYRGLANDAYYILQADTARYADYTGCGNTLNANHSIVRRLIRDSLRYWVTEMHVDGFRFDLASILTRDESGAPLPNPPVLWDIESDPILAGTKLVAEAWDAGGLYQVGSFVGDAWQEWNGRFRDDVRKFVKGDRDAVRPLACRLIGSPDLYEHKQREVEQSINFVTCHDGFTLNDLVSYNGKHNEMNGEGNRDGTSDNLSWNCGTEGPADDPVVVALRRRQMKNLLTITMLSAGTPMFRMGDELRHTQHGNNNAWCQDSELSWLDWRARFDHGDMLRFVQQLTALRQIRDLGPRTAGLTLIDQLARAHVTWHGVALDRPDWSPDSHSLALTASTPAGRYTVHAMFNAYWAPLVFELPPAERSGGRCWRRVIDTALPSPDDIALPSDATAIPGPTYTAAPRSVVLLSAERVSGV